MTPAGLHESGAAEPVAPVSGASSGDPATIAERARIATFASKAPCAKGDSW